VESYRRLIVLGFIALPVLLLMWLVGRILLLLFCGILLALLLRSLANLVGRSFHLPNAVSMAVALALMFGLIGGAFYFLAPQVLQQSAELWQNVVAGADRLHAEILRRFPDIELPAGQLPGASQLAGQLFGLTSSVLDIFVTFGIILFVGIYGAADPALYIAGLLRLFKPALRPRVEELVLETGRALRWWLLGRAIAMLAVGVLVMLGLWIGGVALAFTLGVVAAILTFIPYVGAIVSAIPAVLIAFAQGPHLVLYVLGVIAVAHVLEGYIVIPLVQQRIAHLPPALLLASQAILGTLFGMLGITLAAPLTVAGMVATKLLYLRDVLGEPAQRAADRRAL
jgi:predicted PurR-regulated permease PerM